LEGVRGGKREPRHVSDMLRVKRSVAAHYSVLHQAPSGSVLKKEPVESGTRSKVQVMMKAKDENEIALEDEEEVQLEQVSVPATVFGGVGALERLKKGG
jgi:hypothetical protein